MDLALGRELAQREGAVATVGGDVSEVGGTHAPAGAIVDPTNGEDVGAVRETARDSTDVLEAIDRLAKGVRRRLGESARSLKAAPALARATTTSVEALRKYTQALSLKENAATQADATELLEEAVKLDTGFALAWRELAELRVLPSGSWEALRHAMSNRDRLTAGERAFTEATYYDYGNNQQGAIAALKTVVKLDPGNATAWGNLSGLLLFRAADDSRGAGGRAPCARGVGSSRRTVRRSDRCRDGERTRRGGAAGTGLAPGRRAGFARRDHARGVVGLPLRRISEGRQHGRSGAPPRAGRRGPRRPLGADPAQPVAAARAPGGG